MTHRTITYGRCRVRGGPFGLAWIVERHIGGRWRFIAWRRRRIEACLLANRLDRARRSHDAGPAATGAPACPCACMADIGCPCQYPPHDRCGCRQDTCTACTQRAPGQKWAHDIDRNHPMRFGTRTEHGDERHDRYDREN